MSDVRLNGRRYRLNVGIVLFNAAGQVWLGRRAGAAGEGVWQFPQGGVDPGEDLLEAARRELHEETGVVSVRLIGQAPGWITYDFPEGFQGSKAMRGFAGQTQCWFAFRFEGEESEIDLAGHEQIEFDAWRWADLEEAPERVVAFKRDAYRRVVEAFRPIAAGRPLAGSRGALLMVHGAGCTGSAFRRMGEDFARRGWRVEAPTLSPHLRVGRDPPPALAALELRDYVAEAEGWAVRLAEEAGAPPVLVGHAMGGLIVQKLLERGRGRAGVLLSPTPPAGVPARRGPAQAFTFANILLAPGAERRAHKIWRPGFEYGVLNRVPRPRRGDVYAEAVYDSGRVWRDLAAPDRAPGEAGRIDERRVVAKVLTIAAGQDRATPASWAAETARKYETGGGAFRCYEDHAHWIIDEPGTDRVTADIDAWLEAALS